MKNNKVVLYSGVAIVLAATIVGCEITLQKNSKENLLPTTKTTQANEVETTIYTYSKEIYKDNKITYATPDGYVLAEDGKICKKTIKQPISAINDLSSDETELETSNQKNKIR